MKVRSVKTIAGGAMALAFLAGAPSAWACSPRLPQTPDERLAAMVQQQRNAFANAPRIVEYEVLSAWDIAPASLQPPYDGDTHVQLRPVRTLRGAEAAETIELVHRRFCGFGLSYTAEPGTRLLIFSRADQIESLSDLADIIPVSEITEAAILQALARP